MFDSQCSLLQHQKFAKASKHAFFSFNNCQKFFSVACAELQRSMISVLERFRLQAQINYPSFSVLNQY